MFIFSELTIFFIILLILLIAIKWVDDSAYKYYGTPKGLFSKPLSRIFKREYFSHREFIEAFNSDEKLRAWMKKYNLKMGERK